ncbi:hypothetical protein EPUS_00776 [Endocarpon pusillum Z07020]|uniref:Uncharacterized protein n=1 Tax=Endocarpon pusillum (strain Z07020 / HMAS-L-300199) TaxID=1263415 RepID=U1GRQ2_ENDPU|nr:uncharacterized protein EPUS_00776 [Endocarpon pusillum Z07020]ERF74646.1 hypothetical protein EPUS_00776 [Endocarpon pusillum Z07020]
MFDRQWFQDRTLRDPVFHQQVLDQLKELPRKQKKARELRKHYESIPRYLRDQVDPHDRPTRIGEQLKGMRHISGAQASRNPSQNAAPSDSGLPERGQASDGPARTPSSPFAPMDVSQAQPDPLTGKHPAPPQPRRADRAAQARGEQQPEASANQSVRSVADRKTKSESIKLIRLIATNKATKDQLQQFEENVVILGPTFHRLIDEAQQIYQRFLSTAEVAQLQLMRALTALRLSKLIERSEVAEGARVENALAEEDFAHQFLELRHNSPEDSPIQVDIVDRVADNTADENEVREFASRMDLERGFKEMVNGRLQLYFARSRYDRSIQLRITMFRLSLLTDLIWKPKELLLLHCDAVTLAECQTASMSRWGQTPEAVAVEAAWHPHEGGGQAGRSQARGAEAAGTGGAIAKEDIPTRMGSAAKNVASRGAAGGAAGGAAAEGAAAAGESEGLGQGRGRAAATPGRATAKREGRGTSPRTTSSYS